MKTQQQLFGNLKHHGISPIKTNWSKVTWNLEYWIGNHLVETLLINKARALCEYEKKQLSYEGLYQRGKLLIKRFKPKIM